MNRLKIFVLRYDALYGFHFMVVGANDALEARKLAIDSEHMTGTFHSASV